MPAGWCALLVAIPGSEVKGTIRRTLLIRPPRYEKSCPFRGFLMAYGGDPLIYKFLSYYYYYCSSRALGKGCLASWLKMAQQTNLAQPYQATMHPVAGLRLLRLPAPSSGLLQASAALGP